MIAERAMPASSPRSQAKIEREGTGGAGTAASERARGRTAAANAPSTRRRRLGDGTVVGTVHEVLHSAAGELLSVRPADGSRTEILIPFVAAIVTSVSPADGVVEIDPPEGLLDPE